MIVFLYKKYQRNIYLKVIILFMKTNKLTKKQETEEDLFIEKITNSLVIAFFIALLIKIVQYFLTL